MGSETVRKRTDYLTLCAAFGAALFCGFVSWFPITDADIWWHLASGREMIRRRSLLFADPFSFTPVDDRWINVHWLFQLGAFAVHQIFGPWGLIAAKALFFGLTAAITVVAIPRREVRPIAALALCAFGFEVRYLVLVRPTVISLFFVSLSLWCWERYRGEGRGAWLWPLFPMQVVWINIQGLSMLGPAIAACYALGDGISGLCAGGCRWGFGAPSRIGAIRSAATATATAAGLIVLSFVNPYGWRGALLPLRLFERIDPQRANIFSQNISENAPLWSLLQSQPRTVVVVLGFALLYVLLLIVGPRRSSLSHALLFASFFYLAVRAERNILLFYPVACFSIVTALPAGIVAGRLSRLVIAMGGGMLLAANAATHAAVLSVCPKHSALSPFRFPVEAVNYLEKTPIAGNIFNTDRYGGYLLWRLYPPRQVFIDGRFILRSAGFFGDYLKILDYPTLFPFAVEKFSITHALIQTAIFPRYFPLGRALYRDPAWILAYADGASALYIRKTCAPSSATSLRLDDSTVVDSIASSLAERWSDDPFIRREALEHFVNFLECIGEHASAQRLRRPGR